MLNLLTTKSVSTSDDESKSADRVVSLHSFDDVPLYRAFIVYSMFVFEEVLDATKLQTSLERLVNRDGWWKLWSPAKEKRMKFLT